MRRPRSHARLGLRRRLQSKMGLESLPLGIGLVSQAAQHVTGMYKSG
jgi:hypothetical protein